MKVSTNVRCVFFRRERREKHHNKERKRNREEVTPEDETDYRYNRHRGAPAFRHSIPPPHPEHERWPSGVNSRDRYPGPEHPSRQFSDYQRTPGYHRERDFIRPDKRLVIHIFKYDICFYCHFKCQYKIYITLFELPFSLKFFTCNF